MKIYHRFMEYFWLAVAVLTAVYAGLGIRTAGFDNTDKTLLLMPVIALVLFGVRRWHNRRRMDS